MPTADGIPGMGDASCFSGLSRFTGAAFLPVGQWSKEGLLALKGLNPELPAGLHGSVLFTPVERRRKVIVEVFTLGQVHQYADEERMQPEIVRRLESLQPRLFLKDVIQFVLA